MSAGSPAALWQRVLEQLKAHVPPEAFETWLAPTRGVELQNDLLMVEVPNLFVQVLNNTPENIDGNQRATYILTRSPAENAFGGSSVQFTLSVKSLTDALFAVYGTTADKTKIKVFMKVTGVQSGAVQDIGIIIDKNL